MTTTPRDRVLATPAHEFPDRVPIVLGPTTATGIKMGTYRRIKALAGIEAPEERYIYEWPELGTALLDEATAQRLRADVRPVLDHFPRAGRERNEARAPLSPMNSHRHTHHPRRHTVLTTVRVADADDRDQRRPAGHDRMTRMSRKWVAQEMHGS